MMIPCDLLLDNVTIVTSDPRTPVVRDGAIAVAGSRLCFVGPAAEAGPLLRPLRRLSMAGRVVTPGFVNVHTHAILSMVRGVAEDLGFAPAYTPGIPHGHDVTPEDAWALARLGALEALMFGSTLINDSFVHAEVTVEAMASLGLRVWSCGRIHDADFSQIGDGRWSYHGEIGDKTLGAAVALAERWHGKADGRIGVQFAAHAPDTCSDAFLARIAATADHLGLRVNTHLAQSRAEVRQVRARSGRSPVEVLDAAGLLNDRLIATHCLFLDDGEIERIGRAGVHIAHIPKGNATGGTVAPTAKLRAAGAKLVLGTDNMHADMVEVMRWALAMGRVQAGGVPEDWQPAHVLQWATMGGAAAMGLDDQIGSLEVGKKADLVVFDFRRPHLTPLLNPIGSLVHVAQGRDVEMVVVDGRVLVEDGQPTLADMAEICREGQAAADRLWRVARGGAS